MTRQYSAAKTRSVLNSLKADINISLPEDFGDPDVLVADGGLCTAFFPRQLQMVYRYQNHRPLLVRPIGQGVLPIQALSNLFKELANQDYEQIMVVQPSGWFNLYIPEALPYGTAGFRLVGNFPPLPEPTKK